MAALEPSRVDEECAAPVASAKHVGSFLSRALRRAACRNYANHGARNLFERESPAIERARGPRDKAIHGLLSKRSRYLTLDACTLSVSSGRFFERVGFSRRSSHLVISNSIPRDNTRLQRRLLKIHRVRSLFAHSVLTGSEDAEEGEKRRGERRTVRQGVLTKNTVEKIGVLVSRGEGVVRGGGR